MPPVESSKIALFGGSFDPVHLGHTAIAKAAHEECGLDLVIFLPCWQSPHKSRRLASADHRAAMLNIATRDLPWVQISTWELERRSPSYSWATAEHFSNEHPEAELHWILGTDQWHALNSWAKPDRLAELLTFVVFPRGDKVEPQEKFRHLAIDTRHPASSTEARRRVSASKDTSNLLDPAVDRYIRENKLYQSE